MSYKEKWTKKIIKDRLKTLYKRYGTITYSLLKQYYKNKEICNLETIREKFGSLKNACEEAGVIYYSRIGQFTENDINNSIKILSNNYKYLNYKQVKEFCKNGIIPCKISYFGKLGGLRKILNKYGIIYPLIKGRDKKAATFLFFKEYAKNHKEITFKTILDKSKMYLIYHPSGIKYHFGSITKLCKRVGLSYNSKFFKYPIKSHIGKNEEKILHKIEYIKDIRLKRQYYICGYYLDGYDAANNIAYEIDEPHHFSHPKHIMWDKIREKRIKNMLGCKFIRIPEQEVLNNPDSLSNIIAQSD